MNRQDYVMWCNLPQTREIMQTLEAHINEFALQMVNGKALHNAKATDEIAYNHVQDCAYVHAFRVFRDKIIPACIVNESKINEEATIED